EGQDVADAVRRHVPGAVPQPLAAPAEPGPRHVQLKDDGGLDAAAVPLDDVQHRPPAAGRRAGADDRQLALAVRAEQAAAQDAVEVAGGGSKRRPPEVVKVGGPRRLKRAPGFPGASAYGDNFSPQSSQ